MAKEVFNRHELKFLINSSTYKAIKEAFRPHIKLDPHGNRDGYYTISNIYYDTEDHLFHHEKMFGQPFRQKLRLRTYNAPTLESESFLEIKKKHHGFVNKRRTILKLKDAYQFFHAETGLNTVPNVEASNTQILKEAHFLKTFYQLKPKVLLSYDRQAFQGIHQNDLRITFDKNLRKRVHDIRLEKGCMGDLYVDPDVFVLEIKVSEKLPVWLTRILSDFRCNIQSFSKYSTSQNHFDTLTIQNNIANEEQRNGKVIRDIDVRRFDCAGDHLRGSTYYSS